MISLSEMTGISSPRLASTPSLSSAFVKRVPGIFQKPQKLQFRAQIMAYRILTRYQPLPSKIALTAGVRAEVGAQEGVSEPGGQAGCVELGVQTAVDRDLGVEGLVGEIDGHASCTTVLSQGGLPQTQPIDTMTTLNPLLIFKEREQALFESIPYRVSELTKSVDIETKAEIELCALRLLNFQRLSTAKIVAFNVTNETAGECTINLEASKRVKRTELEDVRENKKDMNEHTEESSMVVSTMASSQPPPPSKPPLSLSDKLYIQTFSTLRSSPPPSPATQAGSYRSLAVQLGTNIVRHGWDPLSSIAMMEEYIRAANGLVDDQNCLNNYVDTCVNESSKHTNHSSKWKSKLSIGHPDIQAFIARHNSVDAGDGEDWEWKRCMKRELGVGNSALETAYDSVESVHSSPSSPTSINLPSEEDSVLDAAFKKSPAVSVDNRCKYERIRDDIIAERNAQLREQGFFMDFAKTKLEMNPVKSQAVKNEKKKENLPPRRSGRNIHSSEEVE